LNGFSDADVDVPVMDWEQIGRRAILKVSASEEAIVMLWRSWTNIPLGQGSRQYMVEIVQARRRCAIAVRVRSSSVLMHGVGLGDLKAPRDVQVFVKYIGSLWRHRNSSCESPGADVVHDVAFPEKMDA
jgi:hypothetical protein